jgi:holo-ACP synthase
MPYDESRRSLLAARDARQALLDRHLADGGPALVAVALNLPGPEKAPPGSQALFDWAVERATTGLPGARAVHLGRDALGRFAILAVPIDAVAVKGACLAIEASRPAARLVDLDVYQPGGRVLDRARLGLPPRRCLACDQPARECILLARHDSATVVARAHALLADHLRP